MNVNQRIVCAANLICGDIVVTGVRHYDEIMRDQINRIAEPFSSANVVQGFVDNTGKFLTRKEAWIIADSAGQIIRRVGGDMNGVGVGTLFSENLY